MVLKPTSYVFMLIFFLYTNNHSWFIQKYPDNLGKAAELAVSSVQVLSFVVSLIISLSFQHNIIQLLLKHDGKPSLVDFWKTLYYWAPNMDSLSRTCSFAFNINLNCRNVILDISLSFRHSSFSPSLSLLLSLSFTVDMFKVYLWKNIGVPIGRTKFTFKGAAF